MAFSPAPHLRETSIHPEPLPLVLNTLSPSAKPATFLPEMWEKNTPKNAYQPTGFGPQGSDHAPELYKRRSALITQPILSVVNDHVSDYPTPSNLTYMWGFGSLAGICLGVQIASGIFLAMHYTPQVDLAFSSVEHIMRDVEGGWFLRYLHANGAGMFFIVVYIHILRGLYYGSYTSPREIVWVLGVVLLLLMILTAFIGYVLPWGQMSLWGATVITSLASVIPLVGNDVVIWLWGGFSVDNATLNRFFSLHYLLPFVIAGLSMLHIAALHQYGSNNPVGVPSHTDKHPLYPLFYVKDLVAWLVFAIIFSCFVHYAPNYLGHADNYIPANPLSTPAHIVPEFYVLPFYAVLRSIPDKLLGVVAMIATFICLGLMPWLHTAQVRSNAFRPLAAIAYWTFVATALLLGWIGAMPVESPYLEIGQILTAYFFLYFLVVTPVLGQLENILLRWKDTATA